MPDETIWFFFNIGVVVSSWVFKWNHIKWRSTTSVSFSVRVLIIQLYQTTNANFCRKISLARVWSYKHWIVAKINNELFGVSSMLWWQFITWTYVTSLQIFINKCRYTSFFYYFTYNRKSKPLFDDMCCYHCYK